MRAENGGRSRPPAASPSARPQRALTLARTTIVRGLTFSRMLLIVPVIVLSLTAGGAFVYATVVAVESAREIAAHPFPVGNKIGLFLLVIDLFLVGATMLIASIGFYELFFADQSGDRGPHMPTWLIVRDLNDLKSRVIGMVVLVLAVAFAELAVDQSSGGRILQTGAGVALIVAALTAFVRLADVREQTEEKGRGQSQESGYRSKEALEGD